MATFAYPDNALITEIAQEKQALLTMDDLLFQLMPIREVDASRVIWEQLDNYRGLQQVRGLNGAPNRVVQTGARSYYMEPGAYGEWEAIDEKMLTERRHLGTFGTAISINDLVMQKQDKLLSRRLDRIRYIIATLLTTGTFSVSNADGQVIHTDTFALQTYTAGVTWATSATATPLANFRAIQLLGRGKGVNFGAASIAIMNRATFNSLVSNTNANDLAGRRTIGLNTLISLNLTDLNAINAGEDLPQIVIYDEGYYNDAGTFTLFIPNNKVVVIGRRPAGQPVGEYFMTRNANNPNLEPGAYMKVLDHGENKVPRSIEVHDGHNGGPAIYYPGSVVVMTV